MNNSTTMKTPKILCSLAAFALAQGSLFAATTDPVGFTSKVIPAGSDATYAASMQRPSAFSGTIQTIADLDTIQISGTPAWTTDQFKNTHYALIGSGDREGVFAEIVGNTSNSLDLVFFVGNLGVIAGDKVVAGDQLKIIPFWTLGSLIPATSVPDQTQVLLYNRTQAGSNKSSSNIYTVYTGFGWYDGPTPGENQVIYPDESFIVRTPVGQAATLTLVGAVPMDKIRTVLVNPVAGQDQDIRVTSGVPVPTTLGSIFAPGAAGEGDSVLVFNDSASGQNKSASQIITYYNGFGWYDGPADMNALLIQPAQGLIYRKAGANSSQQITVSYKPTYQP
jgi:uncharacterized protein (TIGR02597 family)